jgi:hypothetical protein
MSSVSTRAVCCGSLCVVLFLSTAGTCKKISIPEAFMLLRSIRSPDLLVAQHLPSSYTVPVTVSGAIAEEMKKTLDSLNLEPPQYQEVLDKKGRFHLFLANQSYPLETRDLLAGVLNPVEMIDAVVSSVLKYKSDDQFITIVNETEISVTPRTGGMSLTRVVLTPKGKYFAYAYDDLGSYVRESWLSSITCLLDSSSRLVHELSLMRHVRTYLADAAQKPPVDSVLLTYAFSYEARHSADADVMLPAGLSLSVNGAPSLSITATYRSEGKYLVFDTRKICYIKQTAAAAGAQPSCLIMSYGAYDMNAVPRALTSPVPPRAYAQHMEKAAQLCRKALEHLRSGSIESSIPLLKKVVADYPETPQAVEARKLLSGLPR